MNIEELNKIRKEQNLSIEELAKKAKLPKSTIEKILFGVVKHPRIDTMQAIERALNLFSDSTEIKITPEDRTLGVRDTIKISVTPEEEEILYLYREIVKKKGERAHEVLLALFEGLSKID